MRIKRRAFFKYLLMMAAGGSLGGFAGYHYASKIEPKRLTVISTKIPLQKLGASFNGFKIVQLTDLHLHPYTQIDLIKEMVILVGDLKPDLIVLTGDYVYTSADSIFELAPVLSQLNSRHGIFAVLGNHDYWTNKKTVLKGFEEMRFPVLQNSRIILSSGKDLLCVAGLDDGWSGRPDLRTTLKEVDDDVPVILLVHEPDLIDVYSHDERVSLQLSGHSHGGQVRLPGIGGIVLPQMGRKYDSGLYRVRSSLLYTSRGIGVIGGFHAFEIVKIPPVRFNCSPEITEIILTRSS